MDDGRWKNKGMDKMSSIIVSVHTMKSVSTVQLKYDEDYVVENSKWNGEKAKFPFKALLRGSYRIFKLRFKKRFPTVVNKLKNKLIN